MMFFYGLIEYMKAPSLHIHTGKSRKGTFLSGISDFDLYDFEETKIIGIRA